MLGNNRGNMLIISYFVIILLLGMGVALAVMSSNEAKFAERDRLETVVFHVAEAGIERALYDLRQDFINDISSPSWADGDINGMAIGPDTASFYSVPYASTTINGGSYSVELMNESSNKDIWVKSTGTMGSISHTILVYVKMINLSPWDNAIFAGAGASGAMVNGNVDIRGSVHILGSGLSSGDFAIDLGGTAQLVGNNYTGVSASLKALVPPLPTVVYNGETVETLNSELRVKNGMVGLSGTATVGEPDVSGNSVKETVDAIYVTDGYGGSQGTGNVYSDNGFTNGYDLGNAVGFPSLTDPHPADTSKTFQQYYKENALVLTTELSNITPNSSFSYSNANGSISMDGSGNLTISGQVYIDSGNQINMVKAGPKKTITYSGTGTFLSEGNVQINVNFVTSGAISFPNNIIGIMTPNQIGFDEAGIDVMGIFYAENQIRVEKQTDIMGSIVSNYFDMGTNVPSIFQVPEVINHLPPGIISSNAYWYLVVAWQEL